MGEKQFFLLFLNKKGEYFHVCKKIPCSAYQPALSRLADHRYFFHINFQSICRFFESSARSRIRFTIRNIFFPCCCSRQSSCRRPWFNRLPRRKVSASRHVYSRHCLVSSIYHLGNFLHPPGRLEYQLYPSGHVHGRI